jgi:hypothetical protein
MRIKTERAGRHAIDPIEARQRAQFAPDEPATDRVADEKRARREVLDDPVEAIDLDAPDARIGPAAVAQQAARGGLEAVSRKRWRNGNPRGRQWKILPRRSGVLGPPRGRGQSAEWLVGTSTAH